MNGNVRQAALVILLIAFGCSSPEATGLERAAIRRSIDAAARLRDPVTRKTGSGEIDLAVQRAMSESARVDARRRWWPFTERTDLEAWSRAAHLAAVRARTIRAKRLSLEHEWKRSESVAVSALDDASKLLVSPPDRNVARNLQIASSQLQLARSLAVGERFPDAIVAAARSLDASNVVLRDRNRRLSRFDDPANLRLWSAWIEETIRQSAKRREAAIVVDKLDRTLRLYVSGKLEASFEVELGSGALAEKLRQGDGATPEGRYHVREIRRPDTTSFHRALLLDYPSESDWKRFRRAKERGEISSRARIGGLIEIHGQGGQGRDWTEGCVALSDEDIDNLVRLVRVGTPVTIVGRIP